MLISVRTLKNMNTDPSTAGCPGHRLICVLYCFDFLMVSVKLLTLHMAKKASFVLINELVIKLRIGNTLLFLNSFTIQTQPSWPYAMNITAGFCLKGCPKGNRMEQNTGNLLQFIK